MTGAHEPTGTPAEDDRKAAISAVRDLFRAVQMFRAMTATFWGVGARDAEAVSLLYTDGPLSPGQLATQLTLSTSAVTALINRLESAELAYRSLDLRDGRRTLVHATEKATAQAFSAWEWISEALNELDLGPDAIEVVRALTHQLSNQAVRFEESRPGDPAPHA